MPNTKNNPTTITKNTAASAGNANESVQSEDSSLEEAFLDELADIYNAEQQLTKALPEMAEAAQNPELKEAFESHLEETRSQISRLEEVAGILEENLESKKCQAMEGLIKEGKEMMEEFEGKAALDAVLIAAAQKVEHYEIATYGTLCAWALELGYHEVEELLTESLSEEKSADTKLTGLAEGGVNQEAEESED